MPFLESIISKLATIEISFFELVSEAEETGLSLALSETPKAFLACRDPNRSIFLFFSEYIKGREAIHAYITYSWQFFFFFISYNLKTYR